MPFGYPYNACCCSGTGSIWNEVTIEGIVDGTCSDCESLNGTYIIKQVGGGDCLEVVGASGCNVEFLHYTLEHTAT